MSATRVLEWWKPALYKDTWIIELEIIRSSPKLSFDIRTMLLELEHDTDIRLVEYCAERCSASQSRPHTKQGVENSVVQVPRLD